MPDTSVPDALVARLIDGEPAAWAVFADVLQEAGDPRGALVALQHSAPVAHHALPEAQERLIAEAGLLGPIERPRRHRLTWARGFWHSFGNWSSSQDEAWWEALFAHPSARFLRDIAIRWVRPDTFVERLERYRPPLERLHWNERDESVDLDPLFRALPRLRNLSLWRPGTFEEGPAQLHTLSINIGDRLPALERAWVRHAAKGRLTELVDLEVWGSDAHDLSWTSPLLETLTLRRLSYMGSIGNDAVEAMVHWPGIDTVEELDLQGFWPDDPSLDRLIDRLERRPTALPRYRSTGRNPEGRQRDRLAAAVEELSATG